MCGLCDLGTTILLACNTTNGPEVQRSLYWVCGNSSDGFKIDYISGTPELILKFLFCEVACNLKLKVATLFLKICLRIQLQFQNE